MRKYYVAYKYDFGVIPSVGGGVYESNGMSEADLEKIKHRIYVQVGWPPTITFIIKLDKD
jgi:hypothetical protein